MLKVMHGILAGGWFVGSLHLLAQEWTLTFVLPWCGITLTGGIAWAATTGLLLGVIGLTQWAGPHRWARWVTGVAVGGLFFPVAALVGGLLALSTRPDFLWTRPWLVISVKWPVATHVSEYWTTFYTFLAGRTNPAGLPPGMAQVENTLAETRAAAVAAAEQYLSAAAAEVAPVVGASYPPWVAITAGVALFVAVAVVTRQVYMYFGEPPPTQEELNKQRERISRAHQELARVDREVTEIGKGTLSIVNRVNGRVDQVHGRVDQASERITEADTRVNEVRRWANNQITEISGRVDNVNSRVDNVNSRVADVNGRVDEVNGRVDQVRRWTGDFDPDPALSDQPNLDDQIAAIGALVVQPLRTTRGPGQYPLTGPERALNEVHARFEVQEEKIETLRKWISALYIKVNKMNP